MKKLNKIITMLGILLFSLNSLAGQNPSMDELQQQLNMQTMNKAFHVEDDAKLTALLEADIKKGVKPVTTPSIYWRPGYTCASIRAYSWGDYRNCRYHYRYYGRYW